MSRGDLLRAPPYEIQDELKRLGAGLRTARLRRNMSLVEVSERIGAGREAIAGAERGNPATSIAIYAALLWVYGFSSSLGRMVDPVRDEEGMRLASLRERRHARRPPPLDDDF